MLTFVLTEMLAGISIHTKGLRIQCKPDTETATYVGKKMTQHDVKINKFAPKSEPWRIQSLSTINFRFSGHSTLVGFTKARLTSVQENLEGNFEIKICFQIALVSFTKVRVTSVRGNRGRRPDAARPAADVFGSIFESGIALNR